MDNPTTRERFRRLVLQYPYATGKELAKALGVSFQRLYVIAKEEGYKPQRQTIPHAKG